MRQLVKSAARWAAGCAALAVVVGAGCETTRTEESNFLFPKGETSSYLDARLKKIKERSKLYPKRHDLHYQIAGILYAKGEYHASIERMESALKLAPNNPRYHFHMGRIYMQMLELEPAEKHFRLAVKSMPSKRYSGAHAALGYALALQNKNREAIAEFEACLEAEPDNPMHYYMLGSMHDVLGEEKETVKYLREYLTRGGTKHRQKAIDTLKRLGVEVEERQRKTVLENEKEVAPASFLDGDLFDPVRGTAQERIKKQD